MRLLPLLLLVACPKKAPPAGGETPAAAAPGCAVTVADDLGDPFATTDPEEDPCAAEKYWDTQPGATTFFVGDYTLDECGAVTGREYWIIHPNAMFASLGGAECRVVWTVDGRFEGAWTEGTHEVSLRLTVDEQASDCPPNGEGRHLWDGEEQAVVTYAVELTKDGASRFTFADSGTPLGDGRYNASHLTFASPSSCKYF